MRVTCLDCGHRAPAVKCDSGLVAAGTRQGEMLGQIVTVYGERRRYYCAKCGSPKTQVEG